MKNFQYFNNDNSPKKSSCVWRFFGFVCAFVTIMLFSFGENTAGIVFLVLALLLLFSPSAKRKKDLRESQSSTPPPAPEYYEDDLGDYDEDYFEGDEEKVAMKQEINQLKHEIEKEKLKKELENTKPKVCEYCGHKNEGNAKKCECCGAPLDK